MKRVIGIVVAAAGLAVLAYQIAPAAPDTVLVQSTTSTQNSGFYDYILPLLEADTGVRANVVAVGTGQAIRNAANGDADVLLVHARAAEEKFVADGYGVERFDLMYNDFVFIGPGDDPARLSEATGVSDALRRLYDSGEIFASRGDDSGTHKKELALWQAAGLDPSAASGAWYRETGSGMGATIRAAVEMGGYTLTDRATWISYGNKADSRIVFEGDAALFNQYGIIALNPERFAHVNATGAQKMIDWLLGEKGQKAINAYWVDGQQLFYANAKPR